MGSWAEYVHRLASCHQLSAFLIDILVIFPFIFCGYKHSPKIIKELFLTAVQPAPIKFLFKYFKIRYFDTFSLKVISFIFGTFLIVFLLCNGYFKSYCLLGPK